jgi:hypothetical protein
MIPIQSVPDWLIWLGIAGWVVAVALCIAMEVYFTHKPKE